MVISFIIDFINIGINRTYLLSGRELSTFFLFLSVSNDMTRTASHAAFLRKLSEQKSRYVPQKGNNIWTIGPGKVWDMVSEHCSSHVIPSPPKRSFPPSISWVSRSAVEPGIEVRKSSIVAVGGFPALVLARVASDARKRGLLPGQSAETYVLPPDYNWSASALSGQQIHSPPAVPMSASESGWKIFARSVRRYCLAIADDPSEPDYSIIDVPLSALFRPDVMRVAWNYQLNEWRFRLGHEDMIDPYIKRVIASSIAMRNIDGPPILERKGNIYIAYSVAETEHLALLAKKLNKYDYPCRQVDLAEVHKISGTMPRFGPGGSCWEVAWDGQLATDAVNTSIQAIEENGGHVVRDAWLESLVHDGQELVGGIFVLATGRRVMIETEKDGGFYLSLGAHATFVDAPSTKPMIPVTGCSFRLLVDKEIRRPLDFGRHHITPLEVFYDRQGNVYTLLATTGGGVVGKKEISADHARNHLECVSNYVLPDASVDVISVAACSRPVTGDNTMSRQEIAPKVVNMTNGSGCGISLSMIEAVEAIQERIKDEKKAQSFVERYTREKARRFSNVI